MVSRETMELISVIIMVLATAWLTIDIHINKRKTWANDPLVGMSWACMVIGTVLIVIAYIAQNV